MNDALKQSLTILLTDSPKITQDDRKQVAEILLRQVIQNGSQIAPQLMVPIGHLIKIYTGPIDSDYHANLYTIFIAIADHHPKKTFSQTVPFVDSIMSLCGRIKSSGKITYDLMFDLIVQMAEVILQPTTNSYSKSIFELESLPLLSALINQLLYVLVTTPSQTSQKRIIRILVELFNQNHKYTSVILSTIFPGVFTHLTKIIDPNNKPVTTATQVAALDAVGVLTLKVLTPFQKVIAPANLQDLLPSDPVQWQNNTKTKVSEKLFNLVTTILSSNFISCVMASLKMMSKLVCIMDEEFKKEFIYTCGYAVQSDAISVNLSQVKRVLRDSKLLTSDILVAIHSTFTNNVKELVCQGQKTRLVGSSGLLKLVDDTLLGAFIDTQQLVCEVLGHFFNFVFFLFRSKV